jgi:hypothetical protein
MHRPVAADLGDQRFGEGVHHGDADAVQAPRHLVRVAVELAPGVQDRQDHLGGGLPLLRHEVHRDPASVVFHRDRVVGVDGDDDGVAIPRHRLVDRVVDHLVDQVVESVGVRAPDVHRRALADRLQALQNLNIIAGVVAGVAVVRPFVRPVRHTLLVDRRMNHQIILRRTAWGERNGGRSPPGGKS